MTTASVQAPSELASRIRSVLAIDPRAHAIEFDGEWWTWGRIAELATRVARHVPAPGASCGVLLRNTPEHIAAALGILLADGCLVTINPGLGERTRADIGALDLAVLIGNGADLDAFGGAAEAPLLTLTQTGVQAQGAGAPEPWTGTPRPGIAVLMLTSGTTGPPKRVELAEQTLMRTLSGAKHYERRPADDRPNLRTGVAIVNAPLVHLGGIFRVLQCILDGRSFCLLPRFEVQAWAEAVRRHRPATASLVPTALRMVLDSDLTADDLASLRSVMSGTAPLDPADAEAFTERFGVPVLTSYAATEFAGGVAGWNLADHREYAASKRGSVGRAHAGCGLRVVTENGAELPAGETGLLEVRPAQFGADSPWIRTTDLARLDADGFLWIVGRADQTIIRGGFKVQPDTVRVALERHPDVRSASVFGMPDPRLGEVPVAVVELRDGAAATSEDLLAALGGELARYELPAQLRVVPVLPRTASGKVDLTAARALLATPEARS